MNTRQMFTVLTWFVLVLVKEVHFLLQEGAKQHMLQSLVQSGQGAHEYSSSHAREQSTVRMETLTISLFLKGHF